MSASKARKARRSNLSPDELDQLNRENNARQGGSAPPPIESLVEKAVAEAGAAQGQADPRMAPLPPGERPNRDSTLRMLRGGSPSAERDNAVPLITINTLIDRPFIVINGKPYDLKIPSDLSPSDRARSFNLERRADAILKRPESEEFTVDDLVLLEETTTELAVMVMFDQDGRDIVRKIGYNGQQAVIHAFRLAVAGMARRRPQTEDAPSDQDDPQTGES